MSVSERRTRGGLARHHALADAMALRAAYIAVKAQTTRRPGPVNLEGDDLFSGDAHVNPL